MTSHMVILPKEILETVTLEEGSASESHTLPFLRLPHPRTSIPALFLPSSDGSQILELQAIDPPNKRSWFIGEEVVSDGRLLMLTPVDPAFLLLPLLQAVLPKGDLPNNFRPADDIFEDAATALSCKRTGDSSSASASLSTSRDPSEQVSAEDVLAFGRLECALAAMRRVCEVKDVTEDITVFRFSPEKLAAYLRGKVARLVATPPSDLPAPPSSVPSAELPLASPVEKPASTTPLSGSKSQASPLEGSRTIVRSLARDGLMEDDKEALLSLGKLRAACDMVMQYVPPENGALLLASYDFASLDAHRVALRAAEAAAAPPPTKKGPKKGSKDAKDKDENAAGKKRKGSASSQGVEKLKKVNTTGMKKLSAFFQKS